MLQSAQDFFFFYVSGALFFLVNYVGPTYTVILIVFVVTYLSALFTLLPGYVQ
jgi:hypothetical protein